MAHTVTAQKEKPEGRSIARPSSMVLLISTVGAEGVLGQVLSSIPRSTTAAIIIFTDVRRGFSSLLCDRLRTECSLHIEEMTGQKTLQPGTVYVVPSQVGIEIASSSGVTLDISELSIQAGSGEASTRIKDSCRKAGEVFQRKCLTVMLSGMGGDGLEAVRAVREKGGRVVAQNEATSLVFDGPRSVVENGLADDVLPLWAISSRIAEVLEEMA